MSGFRLPGTADPASRCPHQAAGARDAAVSTEPGTQEIETTVSVTFAVG
jgi:uncharacterized protein YggE